MKIGDVRFVRSIVPSIGIFNMKYGDVHTYMVYSMKIGDVRIIVGIFNMEYVDVHMYRYIQYEYVDV